jgi:hypothetical protein
MSAVMPVTHPGRTKHTRIREIALGALIWLTFAAGVPIAFYAWILWLGF